MPPRSLNDSQASDAMELYGSGRSLSEVAETFSVGPDAIKAAIVRVGGTIRTSKETNIIRLVRADVRNYQRLSETLENRILGLYVAGKSTRQVAAELRVGVDAVAGVVKRAESMRNHSQAALNKFTEGFEHPNTKVDAQAVREAYETSSMFQDEIAERFGLSKGHVGSVVKRAGGQLRNRNQAARQAVANGSAERGALGRQYHCASVGAFEDILYGSLCDRGESPIQQRAVGTKNVDIAIHPVAVEVWVSCDFPTRHRYCSERIKYLADRGWWCLYVFVDRKSRDFDLAAVTNEIIRFKQIAETYPAASRQHWVIRGGGEFCTCVGDDLNEIARILPLVGGGDVGSVDDRISG